LFRRNAPSDPAAGGDPAETLRRWMYALLAAMACAAALLVYSALRRRRPKESAAIAEAPAIPDLAAEDISAAQLPEDGWRGMAREFLDRGEYRLALRALYLAGLAFLADRQLILIHRGKTNRDYQKELERRARALPELQAVFGQSIALFESGWYGRREVDRESIAAFAADLDRMRAYVR
jgi:hypothetical protein